METTRLTEVTGRLLAEARTAPGGRSAHTLHGGPGGHLRQTVLALAAGHGLAEHDNRGAATLQVLAGEVTLRSATESWTGTAGDHVTITRERHELLAARDSAVLLTILPTGPGEFPPAG